MNKIDSQITPLDSSGIKVAWCGHTTNQISVYNLTTQTTYPSFAGATIHSGKHKIHLANHFELVRIHTCVRTHS